MDITRTESTDPSYFSERADFWFLDYQIQRFQAPGEASEILMASDRLIESFEAQFSEREIPLPDQLVFDFACVIGEAFAMVFFGSWKFCESQQRWVIEAVSPLGNIFEINVFRKVAERFERGAEDSISYVFEMLKQQYISEANSMEAV